MEVGLIVFVDGEVDETSQVLSNSCGKKGNGRTLVVGSECRYGEALNSELEMKVTCG